MYEPDLAVLVAVADIDAAGLPVVEVRTRMGFAVASLAGDPAFQVVHADFAVAHIAGADVHHAIGQFQCLHQFFRVGEQLFVPAHRLFVVGLADDILLDLVELVNAEDTARILAVGAGLFAEAGAVADEGHGQVFSFEDLVFVHAGDRDFGSTHQEEVFILKGVYLVASLGELSAADEAEITRHSGYDDGGEALASYAIHREVH